MVVTVPEGGYTARFQFQHGISEYPGFSPETVERVTRAKVALLLRTTVGDMEATGQIMRAASIQQPPHMRMNGIRSLLFLTTTTNLRPGASRYVLAEELIASQQASPDPGWESVFSEGCVAAAKHRRWG